MEAKDSSNTIREQKSRDGVAPVTVRQRPADIAHLRDDGAPAGRETRPRSDRRVGPSAAPKDDGPATSPGGKETEMTEKKKAKGIKVAAASVAMVAVGSGAALAATIEGTAASDHITGSPGPDTIRGLGSADALYGRGGLDALYGNSGPDGLYGGNERGWADKLVGGFGDDRVFGQGGDDGVYGNSGNDRVHGGYGGDLVVGGSGNDVLSGGPGGDEINARDGQKDTVVIRAGEHDTVYYDKGLDGFRISASSRATAGEGTELTAEEAAKKADLHTERPPEGLFEHPRR